MINFLEECSPVVASAGAKCILCLSAVNAGQPCMNLRIDSRQAGIEAFSDIICASCFSLQSAQRRVATARRAEIFGRTWLKESPNLLKDRRDGGRSRALDILKDADSFYREILRDLAW